MSFKVLGLCVVRCQGPLREIYECSMIIKCVTKCSQYHKLIVFHGTQTTCCMLQPSSASVQGEDDIRNVHGASHGPHIIGLAEKNL